MNMSGRIAEIRKKMIKKRLFGFEQPFLWIIIFNKLFFFIDKIVRFIMLTDIQPDFFAMRGNAQWHY